MESALVGVDDDIDSFRGADDAFDQVTPQPAPRSLPHAVANKNLGDTFFTREFQDGFGRIQAGEDFHLRAQLARVVEILLQDGSILLRERGLTYIDDIKFALKAVGIPSAALQHLRGARSRSDANQDAFLDTPGGIYAMGSQIALELAID